MAISEKIEENIKDFIENNKKSVYAAFLYSTDLLGRPVEEIESVYNQFSNDVKASVFGKQIQTYIETAKRLASGEVAPNFTQEDINGNTVTLEQFKGKHVMLVFWGSWCGPCRRSHPHLVELVKKYKNDVQFIGFASDKDKDKWKEAIEKDKLNFIHCNLFDKLNGEDVAALYNIKAFPTKMLIDAQGKIVGTVIGMGEEESKQLDDMLKKSVGK
jgi:thiol-disulfide isomerase/thioredoxin